MRRFFLSKSSEGEEPNKVRRLVATAHTSVLDRVDEFQKVGADRNLKVWNGDLGLFGLRMQLREFAVFLQLFRHAQDRNGVHLCLKAFSNELASDSGANKIDARWLVAVKIIGLGFLPWRIRLCLMLSLFHGGSIRFQIG